MKRYFSIVIIYLVINSTLFSQTDYQEGYVIKNNGDTLYGFINYQKESVNFHSCNFKSFSIAAPIKYTPDIIRGYGINEGRKYFSANVDGKRVFLEYRVVGKLSLLFINQTKERFFVLDEKGRVNELKIGTTIDVGSDQFFTDYKELLNAKMKSVDIYQTIRSSELEEESLIALFKKYNELSGISYTIPQKTKSKSLFLDYNILGTRKVKFGFVGGISSLSYKVNGDRIYSYIGKASFKTVQTPFFGIYAEWGIIRLIPLITVKTELLFKNVSLYGLSNFLDNYNYYNDRSVNDIYIKYSNIELRSSIRYGIPISKLLVVPHLGFAYSYRTHPNYYRFAMRQNYINNFIESFEYSNLAINKTDFSYFGGLTFSFPLSSARIISLSFNYELGIQVLKGINEEASYNSLKDSGSGIDLTIGITL
jgi:hypothetical protein